MVGDTRQGWALLAAMLTILIAAVAIAYWAERKATDLGCARSRPAGAHGGQGGPLRRRDVGTLCRDYHRVSCGCVNAMHDSFTPLGGLVPWSSMQLGEVLPGGVGSGLYGMLVFAILTVFVAGLMVGRTPEYLGKKIEAREMKLVILALADPAAGDPRLHRRRDADPLGAGEPRQRRATWPVRNSVCVHFGGRQQRFGVRRPDRRHALVQHDARARHDAWPVRLYRSDHGDRRLDGRQDQGAGLPPARSRPTPRCSSACWSA